MAENKKQAMPTKIGGAVFPRLSLQEAVAFAQKLVSKTHVGPQPYSTVFPGVFGVAAKNTAGQVRASALKQYGLLEGKPEAYKATELAKAINAAPPDEVYKLYREACLKPRVFRVLFDTFHGDTTSLAKLRQQASSAGVHPDQSERCATLFAESAAFAKLGNLSGDTLVLTNETIASALNPDAAGSLFESNGNDSERPTEDGIAEKPLGGDNDSAAADSSPKYQSRAARAVIQVNVSIDSSLDTEKLEKQLALLRKYGAI